MVICSYPFLEDGDSLVLEWLAELHDLRALGVDGERGHDQVGALAHDLADQARPLLEEKVTGGDLKVLHG